MLIMAVTITSDIHLHSVVLDTFRLINTCLDGALSKVRIGNYLYFSFPIEDGFIEIVIGRSGSQSGRR